ncbi:unnamed protein product [Gadus morhua 'NCC']
MTEELIAQFHASFSLNWTTARNLPLPRNPLDTGPGQNHLRSGPAPSPQDPPPPHRTRPLPTGPASTKNQPASTKNQPPQRTSLPTGPASTRL